MAYIGTGATPSVAQYIAGKSGPVVREHRPQYGGTTAIVGSGAPLPATTVPAGSSRLKMLLLLAAIGGAAFFIIKRKKRKNPRLTAATRRRIPSSKFAVPGARKLPINDPGHVRAASARFLQTRFRSSAERRGAYRRILAAGRRMGMNMENFAEKYKRFA